MSYITKGYIPFLVSLVSLMFTTFVLDTESWPLSQGEYQLMNLYGERFREEVELDEALDALVHYVAAYQTLEDLKSDDPTFVETLESIIDINEIERLYFQTWNDNRQQRGTSLGLLEELRSELYPLNSCGLSGVCYTNYSFVKDWWAYSFLSLVFTLILSLYNLQT